MSCGRVCSTFSLSQARNIGGTGQPNVAEEGRAHFDAHGYQGSFAAGIEVEAPNPGAAAEDCRVVNPGDAAERT